jgi:hypothetical protein
MFLPMQCAVPCIHLYLRVWLCFSTSSWGPLIHCAVCSFLQCSGRYGLMPLCNMVHLLDLLKNEMT